MASKSRAHLYIEARQAALAIQQKESKENGATTTRPTDDDLIVIAHNDEATTRQKVMIDERPYMPLLHVDPNDFKSIIEATLLFDCFPTRTFKKEELCVYPVLGGNTNLLFQVTSTNDDTNSFSVLVRIFGGHGLIDRDEETVLFAMLAREGVAPQYYGRFANGRIEQFFNNVIPLDTITMPQWMNVIAQSLARLHVCATRALLLQQQSNNTDDDDNKLQQETREEEETSNGKQKENGENDNADDGIVLWMQLSSWFQQARDAAATSSGWSLPNDYKRVQELDIPALEEELNHWKQIVLQAASSSTTSTMPLFQVGYCHNDLLPANILVPQQNSDNEEKKIYFVDFEYGGMNYFAFDIANHINEYAGGFENGGTPHYHLLPTLSQQQDFCRIYLESAAKESQETTTTVDPQNVEEFMSQVQTFMGINHLYWGLWAIVQGANEQNNNNQEQEQQATNETTTQPEEEQQVEFDYILYGSHRIRQYYKWKQEYQQEKKEQL